ncbi:MAG: hypothetical protein N3B01_03105 [Verrucomicrobiae bacterium]|nr:hypothetical protein [Verrucomicrobiae bacterium]
MADPNVPSDAESKKDTVRINLPPGVQPAAAKPVAASEQAKKETAMMGMPSEPKKDTSRVAVPTAKPAGTDVPRPTVRLRREPIPTPAGVTATPTTAARAQVPEVPRPTVKLKVEEPTAVTGGTAGPVPTVAPAVAPVGVARTSAVDVVLSLLATVAAAAVLAYLVFAVAK